MFVEYYSAIRSGTKRWVEHVAYMGEERIEYGVSVVRPGVRDLL